MRKEMFALPELSVPEQTRPLGSHRATLPAERRVSRVPGRFDLIAINNSPGELQVARLHKDAFKSPNVKFHRKILRNAFSTPPDAVQSEPRGRFPCQNL
jgi:hypothetical protein